MAKQFIIMGITGFLLAMSYPHEAISYDSSPSCFRQLETQFFQEKITAEALSLHNVYQSQWERIIDSLHKRSQAIPQLIKQRAMHMKPNPFDRPFQKEEAEKLLMQALHEVMSVTMKEFYVSVSERDIDEMIEYIKSKQSHKFEACFGSEKNASK